MGVLPGCWLCLRCGFYLINPVMGKTQFFEPHRRDISTTTGRKSLIINGVPVFLLKHKILAVAFSYLSVRAERQEMADYNENGFQRR